ncbi:hypothetical protein MRX96_034841 [Rhipicephalus microplus]
MTSGSDWTSILKAMWDKYKSSYYGALDGNIRAFDSPDKAEALWKSLCNDSAVFLQYLRNSTVNITIPMAVSATLKGRSFTAPAQDASSLKIFDACDSLANVEDKPTYSLCQTPGQYKHTSTERDIYVSNKDKIFSFDTEDTLRYKLCDMKAGPMNIKFRLAVYDIDADADMNPCAEGNYTDRHNRLVLLRKLIDSHEKLHQRGGLQGHRVDDAKRGLHSAANNYPPKKRHRREEKLSPETEKFTNLSVDICATWTQHCCDILILCILFS